MGLIDNYRSDRATLTQPRTLSFVDLEEYVLERWAIDENNNRSLVEKEAGLCRRGPAYREQDIDVFEHRELDNPLFNLTLHRDSIVKETDLIVVLNVTYEVVAAPVSSLPSITRVIVRKSDRL